MQNFKAFFVLISLNLRSFGINMSFAVHWNRPGANKKFASFPIFEMLEVVI